MRKIFIISTSILMLLAESVVSQELPKVKVKTTYDSINNKILLRWAPDNSNFWVLANEYGYTIEKYFYQRDGELLNIPLKRDILIENLKPKTLDEWEDIVQTNDYAAIAAQSVYGKGINLNNSQNGIISIVNKEKEIKSRFSFTLFAADQSIEVASYLGLYYEDLNVKENERYLYRVFANVPDSVMSADTASIYYGPDDFSPLPSPLTESIVQEEDYVVLKWLSAPYRNVFSSYIVERSFGGENFEAVNTLPQINFNSGPQKRNVFSTYVDTTSYSGKAYYRIIGKNTFGQLSPPSDTLSIKKLEPFVVPIPQIDSVQFDNSNNNIFWSAKGDVEFIEKVFLEKSDKSEGNYQLIQLDSISRNHVLRDPLPDEINYYRVGITAGDHIKYTLPFLFQNIDSIPPAKPRFSNYFVKDSLLHLSWNANHEDDIAGYRVYKSQKPDAEPSLIYDKNKLDTIAIFEENLSLINNERYYYLVAFDQNGNASDLSERIRVELPDIVPPSPPIISSIVQEGDSLKIDFIGSSSKDVEGYLLYRKIDNSLYKLISQFGLSNKQIIDVVEIEGDYRYRLIALDKARNEAVSKAYPIKVRFKTQREIDYKIIENEDSFEIMWEVSLATKVTIVKVYYKIGEQFNLIKEVDVNQGLLELEKGNRIKENIKLIFI
ncbi:hypothetical protein [Marivirga sp.]|uniref:hypothetical protein n=1 Tax=Marivirga sp. TaxID=2018662 RepID=UPI0025FCB130|nr:hypothetical protein [Marivirga sp.]